MYPAPKHAHKHARHPAGKPAFKPTFQECEDAVRAVLDNAVLAVCGLPRVGSNTVGSTSFTPPAPGAAVPPSAATIPVTSLQEESVVAAKKVRRVAQWGGAGAGAGAGAGGVACMIGLKEE